MEWLCPHCEEHKALPPAVMPGRARHCPKCGGYFRPSDAVPVLCPCGTPGECIPDSPDCAIAYYG